MIHRISKSLLTAAIALYMSIIATNNIVDYASNYQFVRHVLTMDTTYQTNQLKWRAIHSESIHRFFYIVVIGWELASGVAAWLAAYKILRARNRTEMDRAKAWATGALTGNLLLWMGAFLTIGGEWFAMWQSQTYNGQNAAFRMFAVFGIILLIVRQPDPETVSPSRESHGNF